MEIEKILRQQFQNVVKEEDTDALSDYASKLTEGISDHFTVEKILDATIEGASIFDSQELIDSVKSLFLLEIKSAMVVGIEILGICIIIGLLKNLSGSFGSKSIYDLSSMICSTVIVGIALVNYETAYQLTENAMETITYTMELILPVLIAILISMGQISSGTIMSPLLLSLITLFQSVVKNVVLPGIFLSTIMSFLNCLTKKDYVNRFSKFLRRASLFVIGLMTTILSGIVTIQGLISKTADGLLIDTAKYSLDAFIPIVGGFTADTIELFLKCMSSIKGIVGIFGILTISALILIPIMKTVSIAFIYKVTGLLIEPVADKGIAEGVSDIGTALISLAAVLFFSSLMFIIFIASIMTIGGK